MNIEDLRKIQPIPGFDCVKMKHDIQAKIYEEIKDMTMEECIAYFRRGSVEYCLEMNQHKSIQGDPILREEPPPFNAQRTEPPE